VGILTSEDEGSKKRENIGEEKGNLTPEDEGARERERRT
jgi:hypothetical protein